MSSWANFVGNLAVAVTICLFLSGSQVCVKIYKKGLTGEISALPFLSAALNTSIFIIYGIIVNNLKVLIVNVVGFILEALYLMFYFHYTLNKKKLLHQILLIVLAVISIVYYTFIFESQSQNSINVVGYIGVVFNIIMFGSPLASISNVLKTRSTETMSFELCLANFTTAFLWSIYGSMINDYFITVPNIVGSILGFSQLALFAKFPEKAAKPELMQF